MIAAIQSRIYKIFKKIVEAAKEDIRGEAKAQIKGVFSSYARGDFHVDRNQTL